MSRVFFASDLHLGHTNMIQKYRGFSNNEDYFTYLKARWNKVVTKRDKVFITGDITMEKTKQYPLLNELNGNKVFVLGNHDPIQKVGDSLLNYGSIAGMVKYKGFWITHAPIHPSELRGKRNIHGHTHARHIKRFGLWRDSRYLNVSLDVIDFKPIEFGELIN